MKKQPSKVTITISISHLEQYLKFLCREADDIDHSTHPKRAVITFNEWNGPRCDRFHCEGIPFAGYHGPDAALESRRMCGDGTSCMEIASTKDGRLYMLVDETSGLPDWESSDEMHGYLAFERECLHLMNSSQPCATA